MQFVKYISTVTSKTRLQYITIYWFISFYDTM